MAVLQFYEKYFDKTVKNVNTGCKQFKNRNSVFK